MTECDFCGEEFDSEEELHIHWGEEHGDELNSHQEEKVKKAERKQEENKKKKMARRKKLGGQILAGTAALIVIGLLGTQYIQNSGGGTSEPTDISIENEPVIGDENASVTIVEFGDYQCPACNQFEQQIYPQIKEDYIETGKAKMVWKDYPLTAIHDWAQPAAETMQCVYQEGGNEAFWNVKETVFRKQGQLSLNNVREEIKSYAEEENVSDEALQSCQNPGAEVNRDKSQGRSSGVTGTPTVFVNGEKVQNSMNYGAIKAKIEQELQQDE